MLSLLLQKLKFKHIEVVIVCTTMQEA